MGFDQAAPRWDPYWYGKAAHVVRSKHNLLRAPRRPVLGIMAAEEPPISRSRAVSSAERRVRHWIAKLAPLDADDTGVGCRRQSSTVGAVYEP